MIRCLLAEGLGSLLLAATVIGSGIMAEQLAGGNIAVALLHTSLHSRTKLGQWLAEFVAMFGLIVVVLGRRRSSDAPWMVAGWIGAAYWFTASTSFANPAITVARSLSNSFAGIRPEDVPAFVLAQLIGAPASQFP
jgi:glycerol uptake facilitator-like aquaporin